MAVTLPINSAWTRKSMRRFSSSPVCVIYKIRLPNQGHGQLVVTLPLLSSSSRCAGHASSRHAGWLLGRFLTLHPLIVSSSCCAASRCLVMPAGCRIIISCCPLIGPSSLPSFHCARRDNSKGKQVDRGRDDGDERHNNGWHDDATGKQGDRQHDETMTARGSRATGGMTAATGGTTTATGGTTMSRGSRAKRRHDDGDGRHDNFDRRHDDGHTTTARGRKRQQHHHQRTNRSTIVNTFTSPDNLDLFKLIYSI